MVDDYRKKWHSPSLPFYWVQLSSLDTANYDSQYWPQFRDEQRKLLHTITNGGMAVSSDVGARNNVHPYDKKTVSKRLARWALYSTYGKDVIPSGPLAVKAAYGNREIIVSFERTGKGLHSADRKALRGFSLDGKPVTRATIQSNTVVIPVKVKPNFITYGWRPYTDANLVNSAGLPASTFKIKVE